MEGREEVADQDRTVVTVIKWAYRYGVLTPDECDTLDEAVRSAWWAAEDGQEALDSIEVIYEDGTEVLDRKAVNVLTKPIEEAQDKAHEERPTPTVILDLRGPDGKWGPYSSYVERAKADEDVERFRRLLGADRVRLRKYGTLTQIVD